MIPLSFKARREKQSRLVRFLRRGEDETGLIKGTGFLFEVI